MDHPARNEAATIVNVICTVVAAKLRPVLVVADRATKPRCWHTRPAGASHKWIGSFPSWTRDPLRLFTH